jgi:hypothetical protein
VPVDPSDAGGTHAAQLVLSTSAAASAFHASFELEIDILQPPDPGHPHNLFSLDVEGRTDAGVALCSLRLDYDAAGAHLNGFCPAFAGSSSVLLPVPHAWAQVTAEIVLGAAPHVQLTVGGATPVRVDFASTPFSIGTASLTLGLSSFAPEPSGALRYDNVVLDVE